MVATYGGGTAYPSGEP